VQNFPEGMAVSLPLIGFGYSRLRAFMYGQLSGMVEPVAAVFGAALVTIAEPILPYALSFAAGKSVCTCARTLVAGAMIYVVFDDIIPEAQMHGNGRLASWSAIIGFVIMMCLDVALG
jgi:zinc transporter 11